MVLLVFEHQKDGPSGGDGGVDGDGYGDGVGDGCGGGDGDGCGGGVGDGDGVGMRCVTFGAASKTNNCHNQKFQPPLQPGI